MKSISKKEEVKLKMKISKFVSKIGVIIIETLLFYKKEIRI